MERKRASFPSAFKINEVSVLIAPPFGLNFHVFSLNYNAITDSYNLLYYYLHVEKDPEKKGLRKNKKGKKKSETSKHH